MKVFILDMFLNIIYSMLLSFDSYVGIGSRAVKSWKSSGKKKMHRTFAITK